MTSAAQTAPDAQARIKRITDHCYSYKGADVQRSMFQLISTAAIFFSTLGVLFWALRHDVWWLYALFVVPAGGLIVRMFIMQHDCGHGSFFPSRRANDIAGSLISLFTFLPYDMWRRAHNMHHAGSGNLDRRGVGDVNTLTVKEYEAMPAKKRLLYRLYRHPLILLVLGPPVYILILQRMPALQIIFFDKRPKPLDNAWRSALTLNLLIILLYGGASFVLGWQTVLGIYLPVLLIAFWIGQWLFFIQHQYEDTYWHREDKWSYADAAISGSSYYALPRVLQWFTGNIGFHHIHHLCPAIPNYRLQECFEADAELSKVNRITLRQSLKSINLALWDEDKLKLISFRELGQAC